MNERRWLVFIFALYFVFAVGYSVLIPPWEGTDEPAHYGLVTSLVRGQGFPPPSENYEAYHPQFFYRAASVILAPFYATNPEWVDEYFPPKARNVFEKRAPIYSWTAENFRLIPGLLILRWVNVFLGAGALWLNYLAIRNFSRGEVEVSLISLSLAAFLPQYLHVSASFSNDAIANLAGAGLFWGLSKEAYWGKDWRYAMGLCLGAMVFPFVSKLTVLGVSLGVILLVVRGQQKTWNWKLLGAISFAGLILVGGVWALSPIRFAEGIEGLSWRVVGVRPETFQWEAYRDQLDQVLWSFWGIVGWLSVSLPRVHMEILSWLALLGGLRSVWELRPNPSGEISYLGKPGALWLLFGLSLMAVARNALLTAYSQGRFLYPALGVIVFLVAGGWYRLLPTNSRRYLIYVVIAILLYSNLVLWLTGIIPFYFQPFLD